MGLASLVDRLPGRAAVPLRARLGDRDVETRHLHRYVSSGATVLDVGAHKGAYTWHLAALVGRAGHVHAFEPQPRLAGRLDHWAPTHVTVHPVALSDEGGPATLTIPVWDATDMLGHATLEDDLPADTTTRRVTVQARVLDDLDLSPSFLKADVEGHELAVLRGGERTVRRCRPVLLLEIDYRHAGERERRRTLLDWLDSHDYVAHHVSDDGAVTPVGRLDPDLDPNDGLRSSTYVYNWFLLPAS